MTNSIATEFEIDNRRTAPRLNTNLTVRHNGNRGATINLSATGIRLATRFKTSPTMQFDLRIGNETLQLRGETKWSQQVGGYTVIGAHFEETPDLSKLAAALYAQIS